MESWSSIVGQTLAVYSEPGRQLSVRNSRLKSINKVGSVTLGGHMLRLAYFQLG